MNLRTSSRGARAVLAAGCVAALTAGTAVVATPAVAASAEARFIITVADAYDSRAVAAEHRRGGAAIDYVYTHALNGFAGSMSEAELGQLQRDHRVTRIERDGIATASETTYQTGATWGLDRIDQRAGTNGTYTHSSTGTGVHAYVIDTGIRLTHTDFAGRIGAGHDAVTPGGPADDCNGHGTHVAGTVGGATWGVAKNVTLHPVRVLDCNGSGTWSGVIAGMDWVTAEHAKPAVANMSLGGGAYDSVDDAVRRMIAAGVTTVVAAGNGDRTGRAQDACNYSPARVAEAITIGATTNADAKTSWSNYGSCIDFFAPGASITSAWHTSNSATNTISGTSMAAPHVAGVAALHLQRTPTAAPVAVRDALFADTTKNIVTSSKTANDHLLFSRTTNAAPIASFQHSCTDLACNFTDGSSDPGGIIVSWSWSFGDGTTSTTQNPSRTYAAGGTYTVRLTVTDNAGATGTTAETVTVTAPSTEGIALSARGVKVKSSKTVELTWTGAASTDVDVFRDSVRVDTTANTGAYTDTIPGKGGGTFVYKICTAGSGTTTCSNDASVTF